MNVKAVTLEIIDMLRSAISYEELGWVHHSTPKRVLAATEKLALEYAEMLRASADRSKGARKGAEEKMKLLDAAVELLRKNSSSEGEENNHAFAACESAIKELDKIEAKLASVTDESSAKAAKRANKISDLLSGAVEDLLNGNFSSQNIKTSFDSAYVLAENWAAAKPGIFSRTAKERDVRGVSALSKRIVLHTKAFLATKYVLLADAIANTSLLHSKEQNSVLKELSEKLQAVRAEHDALECEMQQLIFEYESDKLDAVTAKEKLLDLKGQIMHLCEIESQYEERVDMLLPLENKRKLDLNELCILIGRAYYFIYDFNFMAIIFEKVNLDAILRYLLGLVIYDAAERSIAELKDRLPRDFMDELINRQGWNDGSNGNGTSGSGARWNQETGAWEGQPAAERKRIPPPSGE